MKGRISFRLKDIVIMLLLLMEFRMLFLIPLGPLTKLNTYHNKMLEVAWVGVILICFMHFKVSDYKLRGAVGALLVMVTLSMVYAFIRYPGIEAKEVIVPFFSYLLLLLYFPLSDYLDTEEGMRRFIFTLQIICIVACAVMVLQAFIYNSRHKLFLSIYEIKQNGGIPSNKSNTLRDGHLRITYLTTGASIAMVISLVNLIALRTKSLLDIGCIGVSGVYFLYVARTRMYLAIFALIAVYIYFFINTRKKNKRFAILFGAVMVVIIFFAADIPGMVSEFVEPLLTGTYKDDGSYYARIAALLFFGESIVTHPLMGLGVVKTGAESIYAEALRGPDKLAYFTDVGVFGGTAEFGLPFLIIFIYVLRKSFLKSSDAHVKNYAYSKSLWWFIIFSSLTLSVFDPQRVIAYAIALSFFNTSLKDRDRASAGITENAVQRNKVLV